MLRRLLALTLVILMVFPSVTMAAQLSADPCTNNSTVVTAQISASSLWIDQTVTVTVNASNMSALVGIDARLSYDTSRFEVVDQDPDSPDTVEFTTGTAFGFPITNVDTQSGLVSYAGAKISGVSGSAMLFSVGFKAKTSGSAVFALSYLEVEDANGPCTLSPPAGATVTIAQMILDSTLALVKNPSLSVTGAVNDPAITDVYVAVNPPQGYTPVSGDAALITGTGSPRTFSKSVTLTEGSNVITVYGGAEPISGSVILDTIAPAISINGVANNAIVNGSFAPAISVTDVNPGSVSATIVHGGSAPVAFISGTTLMDEGLYTLEVLAVDLAGNSSSQSVSFTIDKTGPVITITGITNGVVTKNEVTPVFSATDSNLGSVTATITVDAGTATAFTNGTPLTAEGLYTLNVLALDLAGNTATQEISFAIDLTAPGISISGVQEGALVGGTITPVFTATDAHIDSVSATIKLGDNTPSSFTSNTPLTADGTYTLTVTATDTAGNTNSQIRTFTIDNTLPVITVTGVADGAVTKNAVTAVFDAADTHSGAISATIQLGTAASTAFTSGTSVTDEGVYTLNITATDLAGNTATLSLSFAIDMTTPVIEINGVQAGALTNGKVTPSFSATDTHLASVTGTIKVGAADPMPFETGTDLTADGAYTLTVVATDAADNTTTATRSFTIDTTLPIITVTGVSDGAVNKNPVTPVFEAADAHPVPVTATIKLGTAEATAFDTGSELTAEGTYTLVVQATDQAGNTATRTITFTIDLTAPVISVSGVSNGLLTNDSVAPIFSATDLNPLPVTATIKVGDAAAEEIYSNTTLGVEGDYTMTVVATDQAGNTASQSLSFTIDKTAPVITISGVQDGDLINDSVTPVFTITEAHPGSVTALLKTGDGTPTPFTSGDELTADGVYTLSIESTDAAGNSTSRQISFTIDTTPPGVTVTGGAGPVYTNQAAYQVSGTTSGGAVRVEIKLTSQATVTLTDAVITGDSFVAEVSLPVDGSYSIEAIAYDAATNLITSAVTTVVRDQVNPTVTLTSPSAGQKVNTVVVSGTVSDALSGVALVMVNGQSVTVEDGAFTKVVTLTNPTEGSLHTITVVGTDKAGNQQTVERTVEFTEQAVPLTVIVPQTALLIGDTYFTNEQSLTLALTGTVGTGATLTVSVGGGTPSSIAVDANGDWSYELDLNANASTTAVLRAVDGVLVENLRQLVVTHDTLSPQLDLSVSVTRAGTPRNSTLPLKAGDLVTITLGTNESLNLDSLSLFISGSPVLTELEPGAGAVRKVSFTIVAGMSGSIGIEFAADDLAGNTSSQSVSLTADTEKPTFTAPQDSAVAAVTHQVSQVVSDNLEVASVTVGGQPAVLTNGSWQYSLSLTEGLNTVTVVATDTAGNTETKSYVVTRDMTGPVIDTANLFPGLGGITGSGRPNFQIPVSDALSNISVANASLTLSVAGVGDPVTVPLTTLGSGISLTLVGQPAADLVPEEGQATVTATLVVADALGNSTTLNTWSFTVNRKVPVVTVEASSAANLAGWTNQIPTITLAASATSTEISYALVAHGASAPAPLSIYDAQTKFTVPPGQWDLWSFATDLDTGLFGDPQLIASYKIDTNSPVAPVALQVTPADTQWVKAGPVSFAFTGEEAGLQADYSLAYERKGAGGTFAAAAPVTGQFASQGTSYTTSLDIGADAGEWRNLVITISLTDAADNSVSKLFNIGFSVDTVAPVVTLVTHSAAGPLKAGETLTITVEAESGLAATTHVKLVSSADSLLLTVTESQTTPGAYTATYLVQPGDDRVLSISASQTDAAGNQSAAVSAAITVKLDTTLPDLTSTTIFDAVQGQVNEGTNHYRAGDLVKVRLMAEAGLIGTPAYLATLSFSIPGVAGAAEVALTEVADGVYEGAYLVAAGDTAGTPAPVVVTVQARDAAGNTATLTGQQPIVIDTTAPVVTGKGHNAPAILTVGNSLQIGLSSEPRVKSVAYSFTTGRGLQSGLMVATTITPGFYQAAYAVQAGDDVDGAVISLVLNDWAGNVTTTTIDRTIKIVTVAPELGQVNLIASRPGTDVVPTVLRAGDSLQVTFTGDPGLHASVSVANLITNAAMAESNGTYNLVMPIQAGMNVQAAEVTVDAVNAAGLSTSVTATTLINIDTLPPKAIAARSHSPRGLAGWYVAAPTITLAVEAGATLIVKNGADVVDVGAPSTVGSITTYTWLVPDGVYASLTYQAEDAAGNLSQLATLPEVKVDTTLPAAPSVTTPAAQTLTNLPTVSVGGTVQAGSTRVALYVNTFFRGYADVTDNEFSLTAVRLDEDINSGGSNSITFKAIDQAGNESALSVPVIVVRDSTAPTFHVEVTQGVGGAGTVTVTASEPLTGGLLIEESSPALTPTGVNGSVYSFAYTGLTGNAVRIRASGSDVSGNVGRAHLARASVNAQQGGTVSSEDGEASATFGPGALAGTGDVEVTIKPVLVQSITNNHISKGTQILGNPYDFQATLTAGQGVSVSFKLNITGFQDHQIGFYYFPTNDAQQPQFVLGTVTNRVTEGTVTTATVKASLPHFSTWAPGGDNTPPDFVGALTMNGQVDATTSPTVKTTSVVITGMVDGSAQSIRAQVGGGSWVTGTLAAAGADQSFSITLPLGSTEGSKSVTVEALDQVQNANPRAITLTLDMTAPTLSATANGAPASGTIYTTGSLVAIGANSPGGLLTVQQGVTTLVQDGSNSVGLTVALDSNTTSIITITARDEAIGATAQDEGNVSAAQSFSIRRDNAPPEVAISGLSPTTTVTGSTSLTIGYAITQMVGGNVAEDVQSVTVDLDGTQVFSGSAATQSGITINFPIANTYTVTVTAVDRAGNTSVATRTVLYDPSAPAVVVNTPATLTNQNTAVITITHQTGSIAFPGAAIQITDGATVVNDIVALDGTFVYTATLTEGDNAIQVSVTGSNAFTGTGSVTIRYDATVPTGTLQAPAATTSTAAMTMTAGLTSEPARIQIQRLANATWTDIGTQTALLSVGSQSVSVTLTGGAQQYRAKLTDEAGNTGYSPAVSVTYNVPQDNTPAPAPIPTPVVEDPTITAIAAKNSTREANVAITGTVTDAIEVEISRGSTVLATVPVADGGFTYIAPLIEGTNRFTMTVTNSAGTSASTTISVQRDSTPPPLAISTGARATMDSTLTMTISSEKDATITVDGVITGKADSTGHLTITLDLLEGFNRFEIAVTDALGNISPVQVLEATRTMPRQATLTLGYAPESTYGDTVTLWGWATPEATYTISQNGAVVRQGTVPSIGRFSTFVNLLEGTNSITVEISIDGNKTTGSLTTQRLVTVNLNDIGAHWADTAITELVTAGVIAGYVDGSFRPEATVTRAEFAKMIVTALGLPVAPASELAVTDASQIPEWARGYVATAMKTGLIAGFEDGSFRADQEITRIQIVVVMSRALTLKGIIPAGPSQQFSDQGEVPSWATTELNRVSQAGLIAGFEDGSFRPGANATRAQAAVLTLRMMKAR